jgi:hypothetical protein
VEHFSAIGSSRLTQIFTKTLISACWEGNNQRTQETRHDWWGIKKVDVGTRGDFYTSTSSQVSSSNLQNCGHKCVSRVMVHTCRLDEVRCYLSQLSYIYITVIILLCYIPSFSYNFEQLWYLLTWQFPLSHWIGNNKVYLTVVCHWLLRSVDIIWICILSSIFSSTDVWVSELVCAVRFNTEWPVILSPVSEAVSCCVKWCGRSPVDV